MATTEFVWSGLTPDDAGALLTRLQRPWWIAGGWAIDLFLGRETRSHEDLDIAMLRGDEIALPRALAGWAIDAIEDGAFVGWSGDRPLAMPHHQFWMRRDAGGPWDIEVLLEDHDGADWRYRRDHRVTLPLTQFGRRTARGVPYVAPEIALLYKAKGWEYEKSARDFESAADALDDAPKAWLRDALEVAHPSHPWSARL